jgi:TPR repeat protein
MKRAAPIAFALLAFATGPLAAAEAQPDPSRFGDPAQGIDPNRFGEKPEPKDSLGQPPVRILKSRDVTPGPDGTATPEPLDPKRFGGRLPDDAYGAYQRGLYKTAYNLALPRAEQGDRAAQTLVAELLTRGLGVSIDAKAAAGWYEKAAAQGVPEAQFQLALLQLDGKYVAKNEKSALELMRKAADAGNPLAQFNLAQLYVQQDSTPKGFERALPYYEKAAAVGLADAQYAMAQIYATGATGKAVDPAKARGFLLSAAKQGFDTAALDLGTWMVEGRGGERNAREGFAWLKRTAEGGNVAAMNRLAKLYMQGIGTDPNSIDAAAWYILARRAGLNDFEMNDFLAGLTEAETKQALGRANHLR